MKLAPSVLSFCSHAPTNAPQGPKLGNECRLHPIIRFPELVGAATIAAVMSQGLWYCLFRGLGRQGCQLGTKKGVLA
ncbi:unnamed protein product [Gulo gulo]|uniref:Uncharacterized protein n=1 Tax=Gulo gulo TaxID=48420 RepID=A0A9X9M5P5_GULGU|nr:unnamed protein product [Gulo gulo]